MIDDRNIDDLLCDYLEGELDAARTREVEELLARDPEKRKLVEALRADRSALKGLPLESLPKPAAEALRQSIEAPAPIRMSATIRLAQIAAVVAITVGASLVIWTALPHTANQAPVALQPAQTPMADGEAPATAMAPEAKISESKLAMKPAAAPAPAAAETAGKAGPESFAMKSQAKAGSDELAKSKDNGVDAVNRALDKRATADGFAGGMPPGIMPNTPARPAVAAAPQPGGPAAGFGPPLEFRGKAAEPGMSAQSAPGVGNAQVVMIVTSSDVSAVQREVDQLLALNRIATDREPMPMGEVASNSAPNPIQEAIPSVGRKDEAFTTKELSEKQTRRGGAGGPTQMQAPASVPPMEPNAAQQPRVVARNLSPTQLQTIRQNMLRLNRGRGVTISETDRPGPMGSAVSQSRQPLDDTRASAMQQMQRQMPSAAPRDLDRALTQARQQAQGYREEDQQQQPQIAIPQTAASSQKVDLLIVFQQLLPDSARDTLPATTPR